jgi:tetratricopeptide (TPR) repeat protein
MPARTIVITSLVAAVTLAGTAITTSKVQRFNHRPYLYDNLYLPSGKLVEEASLGYRQLAADLIWFSAIQYYGGYRQEQHDLAYFEGLIGIVTDLDPHFIFPYRFGAVVMSQDMRAFDHAIRLLKRGMERNPDSWELPFEIGFLAYVDAGNPELAARYFEMAAKRPGGGDRARRFAAFIYSRSGHAQNSLRMWQELLESTDEPYMRELAERYIAKLRARQARQGDAGDI